jgi:hypothetical protein
MNNPEETPKAMKPSLPLWSYQLQRDSRLAVRGRKDLETLLIARSFEDERFKQELLTNPKVVIEKELGTELPENWEIKVIKETETALYMVIPKNPYEGLAESELKANLGLTLDEVACWVYEQQASVLLEETSSVAVITRFWTDPAFKQELLANPKAVIEKQFGKNILEGVEIHVLEETTNILYLILPRLTDDLHFLANFSFLVPVAGQDSDLINAVGSPAKPVPTTFICTLPVISLGTFLCVSLVPLFCPPAK